MVRPTCPVPEEVDTSWILGRVYYRPFGPAPQRLLSRVSLVDHQDVADEARRIRAHVQEGAEQLVISTASTERHLPLKHLLPLRSVEYVTGHLAGEPSRRDRSHPDPLTAH
jgi:hypothetical protein